MRKIGMAKEKTEGIPGQPKREERLLDARSDVVFKKIFGQHPKLTKSFLNGILPLPEGHFIKTITYLPPEQSPRIPSMKNTIVDVKCTDETGRIFIVEMQLVWSANFTKRFLFGASKAFVQQLDAGEAYETLCPVYGLAIVNDTFEPKMADWFHHYRLTHVKDMDKSLEGLEMIFIELQKFKPQTLEHKKMGVLWLRFLREMDGKSLSVPQEFRDDPDLAMAVELVQESAYTEAELEAYDQYLDAVRVQQTVRADSLAEGIEKGERIGDNKRARKVAKLMIADGMTLEKVVKMTELSKEIVAELVKEVSRDTDHS
jgi:predicted transposase/invertase (TIGR01784 family)